MNAGRINAQSREEGVPSLIVQELSGRTIEWAECAGGNSIVLYLSGDARLYADSPTLYREEVVA